MLKASGISVRYDQHSALSNVSIEVTRREIVVILGANGAGKTTLLKAIAGLVQPLEGSSILFDGDDLRRLSAYQLVGVGLSLVPEGRGIFGDLTVQENLRLGAYNRKARSNEAANLAFVLKLFPRLRERLTQAVFTMSGGEQQMVAIGRALMAAPEILMLDEPSLGLSPLMCSELFDALVSIREKGVGILLVEQNARQSLKIADRGYLLETGSIVGEGLASDLLHDPAVCAAYLGGITGENTQDTKLSTVE
jgi:ABC-type branched-subunit amino acid transport system ATPase component